MLHHFHHLTGAAGLPRTRVHDLRHFAATTEVYGHLLRHVAHDAVDVIATALNEADAA